MEELEEGAAVEVEQQLKQMEGPWLEEEEVVEDLVAEEETLVFM
jgi:hypothetical protein